MTINTLNNVASFNGFEDLPIYLDIDDQFLVPLHLKDIEFTTKVYDDDIEGTHTMVKIKIPCIDLIKRDAVISWIDANKE